MQEGWIKDKLTDKSSNRKKYALKLGSKNVLGKIKWPKGLEYKTIKHDHKYKKRKKQCRIAYKSWSTWLTTVLKNDDALQTNQRKVIKFMSKKWTVFF